eukprot:CAMPEP_0171939592 /NCGR_PEP_ID=MMETSP0993-20121228/36436_1 /TAXON_ID=483369 /ORGANISM="non described non described, Strain CCMP2098" /LENGTH=36 /DNA_ID= /DNA_START= /DNA_END= /DNA_ORIENTATION=
MSSRAWLGPTFSHKGNDDEDDDDEDDGEEMDPSFSE